MGGVWGGDLDPSAEFLALFFCTLNPSLSVGVHLSSAASKYDMNCKCGQIGSTSRRGEDYRIVGGTSVEFEKVPWFVYFLLNTQISPARCGGGLINKFWVLSAAHCFCEKYHCVRVRDGKDWKWKLAYNISDSDQWKVT